MGGRGRTRQGPTFPRFTHTLEPQKFSSKLSISIPGLLTFSETIEGRKKRPWSWGIEEVEEEEEEEEAPGNKVYECASPLASVEEKRKKKGGGEP